jgi:hypothetical protein
MKIAALILFLVAINCRPLHNELNDYTFEQYVTDFGKQYASHTETLNRKAIFEQNLKEILTHNSNPSHSWKKGVNEHADLTLEEFKKTKLMNVKDQ